MRYPLFHAEDGASNSASANGYDIVAFGAGQSMAYAQYSFDNLAKLRG